jgi:predicted SprT family Zn-dependent metalloprotease
MKNMNDYKHLPPKQSPRGLHGSNPRATGRMVSKVCECGKSFFYAKRTGITKQERTYCEVCLSKIKMKDIC